MSDMALSRGKECQHLCDPYLFHHPAKVSTSSPTLARHLNIVYYLIVLGQTVHYVHLHAVFYTDPRW